MTTTPIQREMMISNIVEEYPEVVETLLDMGVHCVGCQVSSYESLEEGFGGHGMSDVEINTAVEKLNKVLTERRSEETMTESQELALHLAPLAATKIKEFCKNNQKQALRINVKVGGCSGNEYVFDLADSQEQDDVVIQEQDASVFIGRKSLEKINGATIDYKEALTGAGFIVVNPNATSVCGCGKSFR
ncbi:iron-sulfur cluster assembly accessory protein [Candidatus Woesearchaeota archaeon]|nr:iron-sulfur cluster assembly accessory protein [Candidatus Woesearchaeota archaeon]